MTKLQRKRIGLPMIIAAVSLCSIAFVAADGPNLIIIDEPDPLGKYLVVTVANQATEQSTGLLVARVMMGAKQDVVWQQVTVAASGQVVEYVQFSSRVTEVIEVGITEGPDPIPQ